MKTITVLASLVIPAAAFAPRAAVTSRMTTLSFQLSDGADFSDLSELEKAQTEFEKLFAETKRSNSLSYACRTRRGLEIRLLESLSTSDDAVDELVSLWMHEFPSDVHGVDAIQVMEQYCGSISQAEKTLTTICRAHDASSWPEPHCRLAMVYGMQQRYAESQECLDNVLEYKPWHFEAVHMQVLLELSRNNLASAIAWARQRLPPLEHDKQRAKWVQNAAQQAKNQLEELERSEALSRRNEDFPTPTAWQ